jgi:hypothetical protein
MGDIFREVITSDFSSHQLLDAGTPCHIHVFVFSLTIVLPFRIPENASDGRLDTRLPVHPIYGDPPVCHTTSVMEVSADDFARHHGSVFGLYILGRIFLCQWIYEWVHRWDETLVDRIIRKWVSSR